MALDNAKNFAKSSLASGISAIATSLTVATGEGTKFPTVPFNATVWEKSTYPDPSDDPNVEIVRVTSVIGDVLTITRAQESTSAAAHNTAAKTYGILAGLSAKTINTDIPALVIGTSVSPQLLYNNTGVIASISGFTSDGTNLIVGSGVLAPSADSTTALRLTKADRATAILTLDSTNSAVGFNMAPTGVGVSIASTTTDGLRIERVGAGQYLLLYEKSLAEHTIEGVGNKEITIRNDAVTHGFSVVVDNTGNVITALTIDVVGTSTFIGNVITKSIRGTAVTFTNVPATPVEGMLVAITDSTTAVWGAIITGGGTNHVLGYYNGTSWTVAAK